MSVHVFISNLLYSFQRKMECLNQNKCRKKPPFVDRADVSDVDRTDRLHRQSTFYLTHCAAGDAASGEATAGFHIVHSLGHMVCGSVNRTWVLFLSGAGDMYPLGHPGGEPQRYQFDWRTRVFSYAPHILS